MDIISAKIALKEKGYCWFNLKDLSEDDYNHISDNYKCNSERNLKDKMYSLRADYRLTPHLPSENYTLYFKSFEEAEAEKEKILSNQKLHVFQIWFFNAISTDAKYNPIYQIINRIVNELYGYNEKEYKHLLHFTYYNTGCQLGAHSDGSGTGRVCAVLIYLNEDYNEEDGGLLILGNEKILIPKIGNVAIIDLESSNVLHQVTKVTGGIGRYAILSFVTKSSESFPMSNPPDKLI